MPTANRAKSWGERKVLYHFRKGIGGEGSTHSSAGREETKGYLADTPATKDLMKPEHFLHSFLNKSKGTGWVWSHAEEPVAQLNAECCESSDYGFYTS